MFPLLILALVLSPIIQSAPTGNVQIHAVSPFDKDEFIMTAPNVPLRASSNEDSVPSLQGNFMSTGFGGYAPPIYGRSAPFPYPHHEPFPYGGYMSPQYGQYGPPSWGPYPPSPHKPFFPGTFGNYFNANYFPPSNIEMPVAPIRRQEFSINGKIGPFSYTTDKSLFKTFSLFDEWDTDDSIEDESVTSSEQGQSEVSETFGPLSQKASETAHFELNF